MKFSALISVLFICFFFVACVSDEDEEMRCITSMDCPDGYTCANSVCQPPIAEGDTAQEGDTGSQDVTDTSDPDTSEILENGDSDDLNDDNLDDSDDLNDSTENVEDNDSNEELSDDVPAADNDTAQEVPDEVVVLECPNNCSNHGDCDTATGICSCTDNHDGEDCSECKTGYINNSGTCVQKQCDANKCWTSHSCTYSVGIFTNTETIYAHGNCDNNTGECQCESGWLTANNGTGATLTCGTDYETLEPFETLNNIQCTVCDKNNPPSQYASTGCPTDCPSLFCSNALLIDTGSGTCYYEPTGSHRLYCKCASGYTISGSEYYDANPMGMCNSESSGE